MQLISVSNIVLDIHICSNRATPARTHFEDFSFVFKLNAQTYVGPVKKGF